MDRGYSFRKPFALFILIILIPCSLYAQMTEKSVKRTVAIFPVHNLSTLSEHEYLANIIRDALTSKLNLTKQFNLVDHTVIDNAYDTEGYSEKGYIPVDKADKLALEVKADVLLFTKFTVLNEQIVMVIDAYDVFAQQNSVSSSGQSSMGMELFQNIYTVTGEMTEMMANKFRPIEKNRLISLLKKDLVIEEKDLVIINRLLTQESDYYRKKLVIRALKQRKLALPVGKHIVILVSSIIPSFKVKYDDTIVDAKEGVKICMFDNEIDSSRTIQVDFDGRPPIHFTYRQKKENEIIVQRIPFLDEKEHIMFIESGISVSTLAYAGLFFKIGGKIPMKMNVVEGNAYFTFTISPNINMTKTVNYIESLNEPHFKLEFAAGYRQVWYIRNYFSIMAGLEAGFGFFLHNFYIEQASNKKITLGYHFAYPHFFINLPFNIELFPKNRVTFVLGFAPVFRLMWNVFYLRNEIVRDNPKWIDPYMNYEPTRGIASPLRQRLNVGYNMLSAELFFYDVPITVAIRIKI